MSDSRRDRDRFAAMVLSSIGLALSVIAIVCSFLAEMFPAP